MRKIYNLLLLSTLLLFGASNAWALEDGTTWADGCDNAFVYFDNTNTQYNGVSLVMGRQWGWDQGAAGSTGYAMTAVEHTKLYFLNTNLYDKFTTLCFVNRDGKDSWNTTESSSVATRVTEYATKGYTNSFNSSISSGNTYLYTAANDADGSGNNNSLSRTQFNSVNYNSNLNHSQTIAQAVTYNSGSTYVAPSVSLASITVSGYEFTSNSACSAITPDNFSAGVAYTAAKANSAAYTSTITMSVSNVLAGFEFIGWYDGSTQKSTETSYSYDVTTNKTITARFSPVEYTRSIALISGERWGTICLPYSVNAEDFSGAELYNIEGKRVDGSGNPTSLVLTLEDGNLVAGKPYIFHAITDEGLSAVCSGSTAVAGNNAGLYGSFVVADVASGMYVFKNNVLYKAGTGCSVGANCAYIDMSAIDPISPAPGRYIEIPLAPNAGTNINAIDASEEVVKFFQNGKLFIQKNGVVYDMMGTIVK